MEIYSVQETCFMSEVKVMHLVHDVELAHLQSQLQCDMLKFLAGQIITKNEVDSFDCNSYLITL